MRRAANCHFIDTLLSVGWTGNQRLPRRTILARLFVIVGGFLVLVLSAALVAPYFVDWTSYRADFEREASRVLGREVTVRGPAEARLLPFPSVRFSDVSVAGAEPGSTALTADSFSMDAELAPFLRGEIFIFDMRLERPRARIEIAEDGKIDWAARPQVPVGARQISIEKLTVIDGEIQVVHRAGAREHLISGLDADVSARTIAGPWRIDGRAAIDGGETGFSVSTGTSDESGTLRVRASVNPTSGTFAIDADGTARIEDGLLSYGGRFTLDADPAQAQRVPQTPANVEAKPAAPARYRLSGAFTSTHLGIEVPEFRLETGPLDDPYTADGTARLDLGAEPRFGITADGAQVRLGDDEADAAAGIAFSERLAALRGFLTGLPRVSMPGSVEVRLPAVVVGDTTIRSVRLSAAPHPDGWRVSRLEAGLPGRTTLEAEGMLATVGRFGFDGTLLLAVGQPSGFAAWVSREVDESIRRLPAAGFNAKVTLSERRQHFRDLELVLGGARFGGEIDRRQPADARPSLFVSLDGGELDLDGLNAFASLFLAQDGTARLSDQDVDLALKAGPVSGAGFQIDSVDTALRLRADTIEIDRLSLAGLADASLSATGTLRNMRNAPTGNLDLSVIAVDLAPLVRLLDERLPGTPVLATLRANADAYPGLLADGRIDLVATAAAADDAQRGVAISANGIAGGTRFTVAGSATLDAESSRIAPDGPVRLSVSASNDDASGLYALAGIPGLPLGLTGPADIEIEASGRGPTQLTGRASISGEGMRLSYEGSFDAVAVTGEGRATLNAADLEPWLVTAGMTLPGLGYGLPVDLSADARVADGSLVLDGLAGNVAEDPLTGRITASVRDGRPHLTGEFAAASLDLSDAMSLVLGEAATGDPDTAFAPGAAAPFTAELDVRATELYAGQRRLADAGFALALSPDGIAVSDFSATLHGGKLSGFAELRNPDGTGLFSAQMSLDDADLAEIPEAQAVAGRGRIAASLTATGKTLNGLARSLSGSGSASMRDLEIAGVNPAAMPALLAHADAIGRSVDAAATSSFAPAIIGDGTFAAGSADLAFTIANGQLRAPPVTLRGRGASVTAEPRLDLAEGMFTISGEIAFDAAEEAVTGAAPAVRYVLEGPAGALEARLDPEPLAQFLIQRALEKEQARVEAMQAQLLEQQRLRRETRYYLVRARARDEEAEAARLAEEARRSRQEDVRRRLEEQARQAMEARRAEEAERARQAAEEAEAALRAAEDARRAGEEAEARRAEEAAEAARRAAQAAEAEAEAARRAARTAEDEAQARRPDPSRIDRAPLAPPSPIEAGPDAETSGTAPADPGSMFEVFRNDGQSIDSILRELQEEGR